MVRLGIVGCGGISRMHLDAVRALANRARLTAAVDVDIERARQAAATAGAEVAVEHLEDALPHCDAFIIALPHYLHHEAGMVCLRAGKHVLMEKPLANTEQECIELIETAERERRTLMVGYCMRYHPLVRAMKDHMDGGTAGHVFHMSLWTEQHTELPSGHWATRSDTLGGGQLFSHGCHYVDLLLYFLGRPVSGFHMGTNLGTPWMEREGTSDLVLRFASGALGYHGATWGARGTRLAYSFHAHGTEGMLECDFHRGRLALLRHDEECVLAEARPWDKHATEQLAHFLDCVETGRRPITDGPGSLQGLRVIWRLYAAEREGTMADLRGLGLDEPWRPDPGN